MKKIGDETEANSEYIRSQGYQLVEMYECKWLRMKKEDPRVRAFMTNTFKRPLETAVLNGSLFGVVECDIHVSDHLKPHFREMCPIFKNTEISPDNIGEFMRDFAEEEDIMARPRQSLIGSYFGKKILLATPLLKWYLEHGLVVSRIYQVVEYTPKACFEPFGKAVSDAQRAGDVDPSKAIIADTMKLVSIVLKWLTIFLSTVTIISSTCNQIKTLFLCPFRLETRAMAKLSQIKWSIAKSSFVVMQIPID